MQWKNSFEQTLSELTFLNGRDGSLTVRDSLGRWWAGTSLPYRVGMALMNSLDLISEVGCLLAPSTAALIRAALGKISTSQAIIAVMPDELQALVALHCEDFSPAISTGRLWIAAGENWAEELAGILDTHPGLCVPRQYIRTGLQDDSEVAALIAIANPVFSAVNARRAEALEKLRGSSSPANRHGKIRVVAGSRFALSDLAGPALAEVLCSQGGGWPRLDISCPTSASVLALAEAARDCDALVTADLFRHDMPSAAADDLPIVTWVTRGRIAPPIPSAKRDALLLADANWRKQAVAAGWPSGRVFAAGWPMLSQPAPPPSGPLALIADAPALEMPENLKDFSSHGVLWEQIAAELERNPFAAGDCLETYLLERMAQLEIESKAVDHELFKQKLILPAWRRGVALALHKAGVPLIVYGTGWDAEEFGAVWRGPITNMEEMRRAAASASALLHPDPSAGANAVHSLGRPVVRPISLLKNPGRIQHLTVEGPRLSDKLILSVLR